MWGANLICKSGNSTFEIYLFQSLLYMIVFYYVSNENWGNLEWAVIMCVAFIGGYIFSVVQKKF